VDRTPVLLMALARLKQADQIPDLPVFVDSPMALRALEVYRDAIDHHDPDVRPEVGSDRDLFEPRGLRLMPTREDSEQLNRPGRPCVIISASGMATGGRVLRHLAATISNPKNTVLFVGYQAAGTRGRRLVDGEPEIKLLGRTFPVAAHIERIDSMSAHADAGEILRWLSNFTRPPAMTYLVHGEPAALDALARRISAELGWPVHIAAHQERVDVPIVR
jgi:metallo-beta-lactamase family protein